MKITLEQLEEVIEMYCNQSSRLSHAQAASAIFLMIKEAYAHQPQEEEVWEYDESKFIANSPTAIKSKTIAPPTEDKLEPCIMQSAFILKNGIRIIVYTGTSGPDAIVSYRCDENFNEVGQPFATCPRAIWTYSSQSEYHSKIREMHGPEAFVKEHSSELI